MFSFFSSYLIGLFVLFLLCAIPYAICGITIFALKLNSFWRWLCVLIVPVIAYALIMLMARGFVALALLRDDWLTSLLLWLSMNVLVFVFRLGASATLVALPGVIAPSCKKGISTFALVLQVVAACWFIYQGTQDGENCTGRMYVSYVCDIIGGLIGFYVFGKIYDEYEE